MCDCEECTLGDTEDDVEELQKKAEKMRIFMWENVIEPDCPYRESYPDGDYGGCTAGLAPRCDISLCPRLKQELW